jgi:hypothetical protein
MRKLLLLFVVSFSFVLMSHAQEIKSARVIFYNTENFFDTIKDAKTDDAEFTPEGKAHWTSERYQHKLDNISKVLRIMTESVPPLFIGLSEIENIGVANDIARQPNLRKYDLGVIEHDSPDPRGIDVALLYNKRLFSVIDTEFLTVKLPGSNWGTRDILYVKGTMNGVNLHLFVNHWPSRRGGQKSSEDKRCSAAMVVRNKIAQILLSDKNARIIVMGDLNDNPSDSSITHVLGAIGPVGVMGQDNLYDLMVKPYHDGLFTLRYRGENDVFDQMIVNGNLINSTSSIHIKGGSAHIYNVRWLLYDDLKYGLTPNRTYSGTLYHGGFSDHLPVYMDMEFGLN